jgi:hypothetical protein
LFKIDQIKQLNGGKDALYLEIPGLSRQIDSATVRIKAPSAMGRCPDGTVK